MPKCIVMNVEDPKNKTFEVCVNGERYVDPVTKQYFGKTDEQIELDEMFIHALENAVVKTMIPDPSKAVKPGEVYRIPKTEYRYRVIRLEKPKDLSDTKKLIKEQDQLIKDELDAVNLQSQALGKVALKEGVPPVATPKKIFAKPRGNPNWRKNPEPEPVV